MSKEDEQLVEIALSHETYQLLDAEAKKMGCTVAEALSKILKETDSVISSKD